MSTCFLNIHAVNVILCVLLVSCMHMLATALFLDLWQLEKQGAGNGAGTGTGKGAGPERYQITSLIRAIKWV